MEPVNNEVNTVNVKTQFFIKTKQYYRGEEDAHKTTKRVSYPKQKIELNNIIIKK